jgi:hypothetical protein
MNIRHKGISPGARLQLGAAVLASARDVDTTPVKGRLADFGRVHRKYVAAQRKVDAAEAALRTAQARLAKRDALQDAAVDALARTLIADGHPQRNPFEAFGAPPLGALIRLPFGDEARAIHALVAAVQACKGASKAALDAAKAADKAARAVEVALTPLAKLQLQVRDTRRARDAIGPTWELAFAGLKYACRAAVSDGASHLLATLFPPVVKGAARKEEEPVEGETEGQGEAQAEAAPGVASVATVPPAA